MREAGAPSTGSCGDSHNSVLSMVVRHGALCPSTGEVMFALPEPSRF